MENCEFLEKNEYGDVCHAGDDDECPILSCTAEFDIHGNRLDEMPSANEEI